MTTIQYSQQQKYCITVNQDQLRRCAPMHVSRFNRPDLTRDGVAIPNRVAAEFNNDAKEQANELFYSLKRQGMMVFRNWFND